MQTIPYCIICNNYKHMTAMCYRNDHKSDDEDNEDVEDDNGYSTAKDDGNDDEDKDDEDNDGNSSGEDDKASEIVLEILPHTWQYSV